MTLASYSELAGDIALWLDRTDREEEIQKWIRLVEFEVQRKLGLRAQELSVSGTLTGGTNIIETPVGILSPENLTFDVEPPVTVHVVGFAQGREIAYTESGSATPTHATVWGVSATYETQILVWPTPAADVPYTLHYRSGIIALTAAAPVNYLLTIAADLYLYGCLVHAALFDENPEGAATWRPLFEEQVRAVKRIEAMARAKAGRMHVRPRGATP